MAKKRLPAKLPATRISRATTLPSIPAEAALSFLKDTKGATTWSVRDLTEAVALGLAAMRGDEWVTGIPEGLNPVRVRVTNIPVEHEVKMNDFRRRLDRHGSPREVTERNKIREILRMPR
jgi:hypothetical protein